MELREELENELHNLMENVGNVYIYGTGTVGKRLYSVLCKRGYADRVIGFLNTKTEKNKKLYGKDIFQYEHNGVYTIFIGVGDEYQNEIFYLLNQNNNSVYYNTYIYSFLDEKYISESWKRDVPTEVLVQFDELMMMQFEDDKFLRYDILYEIMLDNGHNKQPGDVIVNSKLQICGDISNVVNAIQNNKDKINVKIKYDEANPINTREWALTQYGEVIVSKLDEMLARYKSIWEKPMIGILWSPASDYFNKIVDDMSKEVNIVNQFDLEIDKDIVDNFILKIYATDDVDEKQIADKICRIKLENNPCFRIIRFNMDNPRFYIKRYGHLIAGRGMELKKYIRNKYAHQIKKYVFDVIIHTADNYQQSEEIAKIVEEYL